MFFFSFLLFVFFFFFLFEILIIDYCNLFFILFVHMINNLTILIGAAIVAQGLKMNSSLTYLDLCSNTIGPDGASMLAESLLISGVRHLFLARNSITDTGAHAIAEFISGSQTLTTVDLSANKIGSMGGKYVADALRENSSVTFLNLEKNELGSAGARNLAEAVRENSVLKTLLLGNEVKMILLLKFVKGSNKIEGRGGQELADAIKNNMSLVKVDLNDNIISDEGASAFGVAGIPI